MVLKFYFIGTPVLPENYVLPEKIDFENCIGKT